MYQRRQRSVSTSIADVVGKENFPDEPSNHLQEWTENNLNSQLNAGHLWRYSYEVSSSDHVRRRQLRYSKAERALSISFQSLLDNSSMPSDTGSTSVNDNSSTLQTQLRFLRQAAAFLNVQAAEARERTDALSNGVLENRANVDPERYREALAERWKEQRKLRKIQDEIERMEAVIFHITQARMKPLDATTTANDRDSKTRAQQNLDRFLQTTFSRSLTRTHKRVRPFPRSSAVHINDHLPRRMTLADITPMRTRPWSVAFKTPTPARGSSTNGPTIECLSAPSASSLQHSRKQTLELSTPLSSVTDDNLTFVAANGEQAKVSDEREPNSTSVLSISIPVVGEQMSTRMAALTPPSPSTSSLSSASQMATGDTNGTATIFSYPQFHPEPESFVNIEVEMPAYAKDLFAGFDRVGLEFGLEDGVQGTSGMPLRPSGMPPPSSSPQAHQRLKYSSFPPPHCSPRSNQSTSLNFKGQFLDLKPRASMGNLHRNYSMTGSHQGKLPRLRTRGSLLSIHESSSLSSSKTSLAPSMRYGYRNTGGDRDRDVVIAKAATLSTLIGTNINDTGTEEASSLLPKGMVKLKRKLSSRLSLSVFGSPIKKKKSVASN